MYQCAPPGGSESGPRGRSPTRRRSGSRRSRSGARSSSSAPRPCMRTSAPAGFPSAGRTRCVMEARSSATRGSLERANLVLVLLALLLGVPLFAPLLPLLAALLLLGLALLTLLGLLLLPLLALVGPLFAALLALVGPLFAPLLALVGSLLAALLAPLGPLLAALLPVRLVVVLAVVVALGRLRRVGIVRGLGARAGPRSTRSSGIAGRGRVRVAGTWCGSG